MGPKGVPGPRPTLPSPPGPHQQRGMTTAFAAKTPLLQSWDPQTQTLSAWHQERSPAAQTDIVVQGQL